MPRPSSIVWIDGGRRAAAAISTFRDYPKLLSWLVLHSAGLPALSGVVITDWTSEVERAVAEFAARWPSQTLLLRSDSPSETGRSPRGGFLVEVADAERESRALLAEQRIVFLLEPASPFDDLYSANLAPDSHWRGWGLEIVGPGFDASDLKRGDVTPQETVRLRASVSGVVIGRRQMASPDALTSAREIRFQKVARMLGRDVGDVEPELRRRGETLLLDTPRYLPIPDELLVSALEDAMRLRPALAQQRLSDQRVMVSLSFVSREARLVFWDVVWPGAKYPRERGPADGSRD